MFVICIVSSHVFTSHYFYHIFGFLLTFLTLTAVYFSFSVTNSPLKVKSDVLFARL